MISLGETALILILVFMLILLLDFGIISQVRLLQEEAREIEQVFEHDRSQDLYTKTGTGTPGRYE